MIRKCMIAAGFLSLFAILAVAIVPTSAQPKPVRHALQSIGIVDRDNRPLFWESGDNFLFPRRCKEHGAELVPDVDELSAYRGCPVCGLRYRHPSWPKTLDEQARL